MLIPIRCFTCGKVLADKWLAYLALCKESEELPITKHVKGFEINHRGEILDDLEITKICCRRIMLTTSKDLIDVI